MTYAELEQAKADMVRPWVARARAAITARFADARAHAERGSTIEANARLRGLTAELGGSLAKPETGLVGEARAAFYRDSFALQRRRLDPEVHDLDLAPSADDVLVAQRHPIGGRHFPLAIQDIVTDDAGRSLDMAIAVVMTGDTSPGAKQAVLDTWQRKYSEKAAARVESELKTTAIALYEAVGRLMLRPEYR
jgi:hypothetical protein